MKGSANLGTMDPVGLGLYGALCGRSLARAHVRTGDAVAIAAFPGSGDMFDGAVADFAAAYADQKARDHAACMAAIDAGRISSTKG